MTYEELYELAISHQAEIDAVPEILEIDYCMHPVLNVPALKLITKDPPSKTLEKKVAKILGGAPCVWWPKLI
jgi:hypothetical protein